MESGLENGEVQGMRKKNYIYLLDNVFIFLL